MGGEEREIPLLQSLGSLVRLTPRRGWGAGEEIPIFPVSESAQVEVARLKRTGPFSPGLVTGRGGAVGKSGPAAPLRPRPTCPVTSEQEVFEEVAPVWRL